MAVKRYQLIIRRTVFITRAGIQGPLGFGVVHLLVDTGSEFSFVGWEVLEGVGYDPGAQKQRCEFLSITGTAFVPVVSVQQLSCLGQTVKHFPLLSFTPAFGPLVDGILGMDFLHRFPFKIDTYRGVIEAHGGRGSREST